MLLVHVSTTDDFCFGTVWCLVDVIAISILVMFTGYSSFARRHCCTVLYLREDSSHNYHNIRYGRFYSDKCHK